MRWLWEASAPAPWLAQCLVQRGIPKPLYPLLTQLHFADEAELDRFLQPSLKDVEDPQTILNLEHAVHALHQACRDKKSIAIVSDYDVDGVTSMALMYRFFSYFDFTFTPFFPDREIEGYGLTERVVDRILGQNKPFDYLISMDCGTNSIEAIQKLRAVGTQVIIVDHHRHIRESLPDAILVNPHVEEDKHSASSKNLCTAGLVFKCIHAWVKILKNEKNEKLGAFKLRDLLDLVALGTIADIVPLTQENRLWVHFGLRVMQKTKHVGLKALLQMAQCASLPALTVEDVSFRLAPRINASGRLASANLPYQLLTADDAHNSSILAQQLDALNGERQRIEEEILQEAESLIAKKTEAYAYVLYQKRWHVGVVGIVAGRLTHKYHKPVFVLGEQEGLAKGSGRSIPEVNLVEVFSQANDLLTHWGGHPGAVGLTLSLENLEAFEDKLNQIIKEELPEGIPEATLWITSELSPSDITPTFLEQIDQLAPFGQSYEAPIFVLKHLRLKQPAIPLGASKKHLKIKLEYPWIIIGWNRPAEQIPVGEPIDLAVRLEWSYWQGLRSLQLQLVDWRYSSSFE